MHNILFQEGLIELNVKNFILNLYYNIIDMHMILKILKCVMKYFIQNNIFVHEVI